MTAYFESGFSVRVPMWHGLGTVLDDYPTDWTDARKKAGLEWEPRLVLPYQQRGEDFVPVTTHRLVERDDNHEVLGIVSDQYSLISHKQMGEIVEAILGADINVRFETAGSIKNGAAVWCLVYLDEPFTVGRDDSQSLPFLALLNAHDGTGACKVIYTRVRIVCWNTYQAADAEATRSGAAYTFRHTGDVASRIEEAKNAIAGLRAGVTEWGEEAAELVSLNIDDPRVEWFLSEFIPMPAADVVSDRVRANIEKARGLFRNFYFDSITCDAHRGTALGLVDAATEYLDHARSFRNSDSRIGRSLLRAEPLKIKAVGLARRAAAASI